MILVVNLSFRVVVKDWIGILNSIIAGFRIII